MLQGFATARLSAQCPPPAIRCAHTKISSASVFMHAGRPAPCKGRQRWQPATQAELQGIEERTWGAWVPLGVVGGVGDAVGH